MTHPPSTHPRNDMDYRAIGEMIMMIMIGLSLLAVVTSLSFHFVLRPVLERFLTGRGSKGSTDAALLRRMEEMDSRLMELESGLERVEEATAFDRRLVSEGRAGEPSPESSG